MPATKLLIESRAALAAANAPVHAELAALDAARAADDSGCMEAMAERAEVGARLKKRLDQNGLLHAVYGA